MGYSAKFGLSRSDGLSVRRESENWSVLELRSLGWAVTNPLETRPSPYDYHAEVRRCWTNDIMSINKLGRSRPSY